MTGDVILNVPVTTIEHMTDAQHALVTCSISMVLTLLASAELSSRMPPLAACLRALLVR